MILMVWLPTGVETVAGKVRHKIFRQRQGVLTTAKSSDAFCNEGGVAGKIQPLDGLLELKTRQNPSPNLMALIPREMREEKNVFLY